MALSPAFCNGIPVHSKTHSSPFTHPTLVQSKPHPIRFAAGRATRVTFRASDATPPNSPAPPNPPTPPKAPTPPSPPSTAPPTESTSSAASVGASAPETSSGLPELRAPNDATPLRTESEVRRNAPAKQKPRRRRRGGKDDSALIEIEWEKADSVPLVAGQDGRDGWVDLKTGARQAQREKEDAERLERSRGKVDDAMKEKLKQEIVQPYTQNWIGVVFVAVAVLAVAVKLFGGFETIPIIPVPDL